VIPQKRKLSRRHLSLESLCGAGLCAFGRAVSEGSGSVARAGDRDLSANPFAYDVDPIGQD
jgi:hypothetical protein